MKLTNIRCFENLTIDFEKPGTSILILGDNGDGKSTVLRSLAMGLCDDSSASGLFSEIDGTFVRREKNEDEPVTGKKGIIIVDLVDDGKRFQTETTITYENGLETLTQVFKKFSSSSKPKNIKQSEFPWHKIFVTGYGAGLRTVATEHFQKFSAVNSLYPLFVYDAPYQNSELLVRRVLDSARSLAISPNEQAERAKLATQRLKKLLKDVLNLDNPDDVEIGSTGIRIRGEWGWAHLRELGDGYRAMVAVILDIVAWWFLKRLPHMEESTQHEWFDLCTDEFSGIVFIDEIEQHLHPRWQRTVVDSLHAAFPKLQFIMTTHSPLCVVGTTDLPDDEIKLVVLRSDLEEQWYSSPPPRRQGIDEILTSSLFSLTGTMSHEVSQDITRYSELKSSVNPSSDERSEMDDLRERLAKAFPSGATDLEVAVEHAVKDVVLREFREQFAGEKVDEEVTVFEIRRQLKELFGDQKIDD